MLKELIFLKFYNWWESIRNSLIIDEGDPYNEILFNKSIQNVKARNIFETVKFNENNNDEDLNKVIDIIVEEKQQVKFLLVLVQVQLGLLFQLVSKKIIILA